MATLVDFFIDHSFTPDVADSLAASFKTETVGKGHKILLPDNLGKHAYFVSSGLLRTYYLRDGKDITHFFFKENSFTLPLESIFYHRPAPYGIEALEPSVICSIPFGEIEKISDSNPALLKLMNILFVDVLRRFSERMYGIQFQSAPERYKTMVQNHPDLLQRAPLGHIASYIGITQQTLSVLRAQRD